MSILKIQAALEKRLASMTPALATALENLPFEPTQGTAYQRAELIPNSPIDHALTLDVVEHRGLFQVTLMYPLGAGRGAAQARAQAIADHFAPLLVLTEPGWRIEVYKTPRIGAGMPFADRWAVPVTAHWRALKT